MDIFGCDLDDELFGETKDRDKRPALTSYNAKICESEWFESAVPEDDSDKLNLYKYRADWAYRKKQYEIALQFYTDALEILPNNNTSMWRDMQESSARCHIRLAQLDQAMDIANKIHCDTTVNFEHKTNSLRLLMQIHQLKGEYKDVLLCLLRLLILHPSEATYWKQLGDVYRILYKQASSESAEHSDYICTASVNSDCKDKPDPRNATPKYEHCDRLALNVSEMEDRTIMDLSNWQTTDCLSTGMPIHVAIYICLERSRILLRIMSTSADSFARDKNKDLQKQIMEIVSYFELDELQRNKYYQLARKELLKGQEGNEESTSGEDLTDAQKLQMTEVADEVLCQQFENVWFEWEKEPSKKS